MIEILPSHSITKLQFFESFAASSSNLIGVETAVFEARREKTLSWASRSPLVLHVQLVSCTFASYDQPDELF